MKTWRSLEAVLDVRIITALEGCKLDERCGPMLLRPEWNRCVEGHRIAKIRIPHLRQPDAVVPHLAFGHERHPENTVGQQQLHAFRHCRVKAGRVERVVRVLAAPLETANSELMCG